MERTASGVGPGTVQGGNGMTFVSTDDPFARWAKGNADSPQVASERAGKWPAMQTIRALRLGSTIRYVIPGKREVCFAKPHRPRDRTLADGPDRNVRLLSNKFAE